VGKEETVKRNFSIPKRTSRSDASETEVGEHSEPLGDRRALRDPEVVESAMRRRFSADYKLRILKLADSCTEQGSLGVLLRREGLYASNLTTWRRQRDEGTLEALSPKKRGPKTVEHNPLAAENEQLKRENERLSKRIRQAELIIDVQKKVSQMLGITLESHKNEGNA
jgi:transposase-like protein